MSLNFRHRRYFRIKKQNNLTTFSDIENAKSLIGFTSVYSIGNPVVTEALADSNQTLVVTYEFNNNEDQESFLSAIDTEWLHSRSPYTNNNAELFRTEWLDDKDIVVSSSDDEVSGGMRGGRFVIDF